MAQFLGGRSKYHPLTDHMIEAYKNVWPNNPFIFLVPYQDYPKKLKDKWGKKIKLISTEKGFRATVLSLLEDIDDEEWVYWSIDDKYPISIDTYNTEKILRWLNSGLETECAGIVYCVKKNMLKPKRIERKESIKIPDIDIKLYKRKNYDYIWMHQFIKAKVLKNLFIQFPEKISHAKIMDSILQSINLPQNHKLYTFSKSIALFGESTHRGMITSNCKESFLRLGWDLPKGFDTTEKKMLLGSNENNERSWLRSLRILKNKLIGYSKKLVPMKKVRR